MTLIGLIVCFVGFGCFILTISGMAEAFVPPLVSLGWSPFVWLGIGIVGAVTFFMTKRPSD
jgi:hypothetical protein